MERDAPSATLQKMAASPRGGFTACARCSNGCIRRSERLDPRRGGSKKMTSRTPEKMGIRSAISRVLRDMAGKRGRTTNFLLCKPLQRTTVIEYSPSCPLSSTTTSREIVEPAVEVVVYSIVYSLDKISDIVEYTASRPKASGL